jgi:hypothetical protein
VHTEAPLAGAAAKSAAGMDAPIPRARSTPSTEITTALKLLPVRVRA